MRLHVRAEGEEGRPWIVLSNSLGSNMGMWDEQMALLLRKYRVLRYDHRGHGQSDVAEEAFGWPALLRDVIGIMDAHDIERADWMGLSMGAMTGMGLGINHGDRFDRLVLADGRGDAPEPFKEMWDQRIAKVEDGGIAAIVDANIDGWLTKDFQDASPERTDDLRRMMLSTDPRGYVACCKALKELDYRRDLGAVRNSVLCVTGSEDKGAAPDVVRDLAERMPNARFTMIEGAAHISNVNRPAAFNRAIAEFLEID